MIETAGQSNGSTFFQTQFKSSHLDHCHFVGFYPGTTDG
jgi:cyclophilin family peptidyl-prolyl cis-trans isomerase